MSELTVLWFGATTPVLSQLPGWYVYGFSFLFGAIVGSFLNVCILRIPEEGVSIFYPRNSRCPECKYEIKWYDNVPIVSWLLLRGKCRSCKTPISLMYPLVELITAVMAVAVVKHFGLKPVSLIWFALICALIVITFIDMAYWIIPDVISLPGIVIGIVCAYFIGPPGLPHWKDAVIGAAVGGGLFLFISYGYAWLRGREGMGMGDAKLLGMLGAFLGWKMLPLVILLASAQGLAAALLLYTLGWREGAPEYDEDEDIPEEHKHSKASEPDADPEENMAESLEEAMEREDAEESEQEPVVASPEETEKLAEDAELDEEEEDVGLQGIAIPFGPFLSLAAIEVLFWGEQIYVWLARVLRF